MTSPATSPPTFGSWRPATWGAWSFIAAVWPCSGATGGFACTERDFGQDNVTVQVRMEDKCCSNQETGVGLVWPNGAVR